MRVRVYLTGRMALEADGRTVADETGFRGKQGRLLFAYLVLERARPVPREELAALVWSEDLPPAWEADLSVLLSRLRGVLACAPLPDAGVSLSRGFGQFQLRLPPDAWVDLEEAAVAVDEAEGALRAGDFGRAFGPATVAAAITRRPFLSGEDGDWAVERRRRLERQRLRSLDALSRVWLATGEPDLAVESATEALQIDPYREVSCQLLMQACRATGNRAAGIVAYQRLARLLAEELSTAPAAETQALHAELVGVDGRS